MKSTNVTWRTEGADEDPVNNTFFREHDGKILTTLYIDDADILLVSNSIFVLILGLIPPWLFIIQILSMWTNSDMSQMS